MPSELKVNKLSPYTGTTLTIGDSGDTISFASGVLPSLESLTITGDLTVDTNTLYVDSTNNRVGVGTTSPSVTFDAEADGATVAHFNRATSDGDIIELQKDGTTVGSIGVASSDLNIYGDVGIKFSGDDVRPTDSSGNNSDNAVDLGHFDVRWQDLYLGGNIYLGGTGSANALNDYEEGTYTPTILQGINSPTYVTGTNGTQGRYVKIGGFCFVDGRVRISAGTTTTSALIISLPFAIEGGSPFFPAGASYFNSVLQNGEAVRPLASSGGGGLYMVYQRDTASQLDFTGVMFGSTGSVNFTLAYRTSD